MDFLTEVDKLVQLIECPIFTCKGPAPGLWPTWSEAEVKPHSEEGGRQRGKERSVTPGMLQNVKNVRAGMTGLRRPAKARLRHMGSERGSCPCTARWVSQTHHQ